MPEGLQFRIEQRAQQRLEELEARSQLRTLAHVRGIDLSSNDYLGLATDSRLKQALSDAVATTASLGSTGSRLLSGNSEEWEALETEFAEFAQTESALYFGSGYAANVGLLSSILQPGDAVFSDALNHASLIDGIRLSRATKEIYPHGDMDALEHALRHHGRSTGAKVIVTETVFSMDGDLAPFETLMRLARDYRTELILDEAHATGVFGPQGRGIASSHGLSREILAIVHTCGKAFASAGAFVCCSNTLKNYLVNHARTFIFSTAMPPYFAAQIRTAVGLAMQADKERAHLQELARVLRAELSSAGLDCVTSASQIVPMMYGTNESALALANHLQANGFAVRAIRPPTVPAGTARVRLSLTAKISLADVKRLIQAVREFEPLPRQQAATVHA